jgi:hypothetical protein
VAKIVFSGTQAGGEKQLRAHFSHGFPDCREIDSLRGLQSLDHFVMERITL